VNLGVVNDDGRLALRIRLLAETFGGLSGVSPGITVHETLFARPLIALELARLSRLGCGEEIGQTYADTGEPDCR